ncbi:virulence RhuM family protein [Epibacterium ulvae]|uniref:virulence RhuM family protein n=1 Tax=Epibacterium ulvae TaxID=1156985 RepID=UPI002491479A|nr:virulence RhuM family protein [Epibacterium ulvae]
MSDNKSDLILYTTEDGQAQIALRADNGTAWMPLNRLVELFERDKSVISRHISNILEDGELDADSVVAEYATTASDGKTYQVTHYNLDMILAIGYRVRSPRGVQFRRWASTILQDYLVKGFVMDDARLKQPDYDYFDELLERIRDIRTSEARFYKKVRDLIALSEDYDASTRAAHVFFATIQNKMLYAVSSYTAAELIVARSDAGEPNMGLTSWAGNRVRKKDVVTAKNYLGDAEISELNLIVTMFLDTADLRARRRQTMRLADWDAVLDGFLKSNELPVLTGAGTRSHKQAVGIAHEKYAEFDDARRLAERNADAEIDELDELTRIAELARKGGRDD